MAEPAHLTRQRSEHAAEPATPSKPRPSWLLEGLHAACGLQGALVLLQAALAGQHLSGHWGALTWHAANARLIEAVAAAQLLLAVIVRRRRGPAWPAALSALLWLAVELQRQLGQAGQLGAHVPLGVAIFGLAVGLFVATRDLAK